jgi:PAS domain S-box-containing protein
MNESSPRVAGAFRGRQASSERRRILLSSIVILVLVSGAAAALVTGILHQTSVEQHRARLEHLVHHRASIIKSVLLASVQRDGSAPLDRTTKEELHRIANVYKGFRRFGETGEFSLAMGDGDRIEWLVPHWDLEGNAEPEISSRANLAEPMRRALRGESGVMVGRDYRGETVLAAYEAIPEIDAGVVAKIDVSEINAPFVRAGLLASGIVVVVVALGAAFMVRATSPSIQRIESRVVERTAELLELNENLKQEIHERQQAEAALRRMSLVFMDAADPIVIHEMSGRISDLNAEVERVYGWSREELLGQPLEVIIPPESRAKQLKLLARCRRGGSVRNVEGWRQTKAGERIPVLLTLSRLTDEKGEAVAIASIAKDLSEQKRLQRQLQSAASEAALSEERERRKLAGDLHDGLGQLLVLTSMKLGMLRSAAEAFGLDPKVREIERIIAEAHERTSSLSFQLSPPVLHDVGFLAAAQWLAENMERRFGLHITLEDDGKRQPLDEATRITLFRGLSEALLNVAKHARADKTHVHLWREDRFIKIAVEDDGVGFDPDAERGGFGLFSVRERLNHLGGGLQIESAPGEGTRIVLTAPVASPDEPMSGESV